MFFCLCRDFASGQYLVGLRQPAVISGEIMRKWQPKQTRHLPIAFVRNPSLEHKPLKDMNMRLIISSLALAALAFMGPVQAAAVKKKSAAPAAAVKKAAAKKAPAKKAAAKKS